MQENMPHGVWILVSDAVYVERGNSEEKAKRVLALSRRFGRELMSGSNDVPVVLITGGRSHNELFNELESTLQKARNQ